MPAAEIPGERRGPCNRPLLVERDDGVVRIGAQAFEDVDHVLDGGDVPGPDGGCGARRSPGAVTALLARPALRGYRASS